MTLTANGTVPNSDTQGPVAAGSHSFRAAYSGDADFISSTSPCEPFTVNKDGSNTATTVFNAATKASWAGTELTGAKAYDTAKVSTVGGITATGTVTYTFYSTGNCSSTTTNAGTVTLTANGSVPNSGTQGPLQPGPHSFQAAYSGDSRLPPSTSSCEPFTVTPADTAPPAPITPVLAGDGLVGARRRIILGSGVLAGVLALVGAFVVTIMVPNDHPPSQPEGRRPRLPDRMVLRRACAPSLRRRRALPSQRFQPSLLWPPFDPTAPRAAGRPAVRRP